MLGTGSLMSVRAATKVQPTVTMENKTVTSTNAAMSQTGDQGQPVEYALPYPGMLPDNPLYFLKQVRDWIMEKIIADPVRKIEFYVLQSDKDINASVFLNAKKESALGLTSMMLASKNMQMAVAMTTTYNTQGQAIPGYVVDQLGKSLSKHEEVLTDLVTKVSADEKPRYNAALADVREMEAEVAKLLQ
jgi:hypothetical protein